VKCRKSSFGKPSIQYLGFVVSFEGVIPYHIKFQSLAQWSAPHLAMKIKRYMGGIDFYQWFIANFSQLAHPLHRISNQNQFL
jgi:hypothetical protein